MEGQQVPVERQLPFGLLFFFSLHTLEPAKRCFSRYRQATSAKDSREVNNFFQFASITRPRRLNREREPLHEREQFSGRGVEASLSAETRSLVYPKKKVGSVSAFKRQKWRQSNR